MQKFNETKQSSELVTEKSEKSPKNAEPVKEKNKDNITAPVDSRQNPVGESNEDEQNISTPDAQDNSMYRSFFFAY